MNAIIKNIPNAVTCINALCGGIACLFAVWGNREMAMMFIVFGAVADFFDGMLARLLKAYSNIGKDLDSLADNITFGLAPALMVFSLLQDITSGSINCPVSSYIPYTALIISVFSTIRLAKFNNDTRQTESFIGLPVPANALFWSSLIVGGYDYLTSNMSNSYYIFALVILTSYLLVSNIPMFSLKFKNLSFKKNKVRFIFLALSVASIAVFRINGIAITILLYIAISTLLAVVNKFKSQRK